MNRKNVLKLLLSAAMIIILVLMYSARVINMTFHELGGLILLGVFIIHIIVNYKWVIDTTKKLFRKELSAKARLMYILGFLLFITFALIGISGIFISETLFDFQESSGIPWKTIHYTSAGVALILIGIHLGLHRQFICSTIAHILPVPKKAAAVTGILLSLIIVSYGCFSIATTSFVSWLTMPFSSEQNGDWQRGGMPSINSGENGDGSDFNRGQGNGYGFGGEQGGGPSGNGAPDISGMPSRPDGEGNSMPGDNSSGQDSSQGSVNGISYRTSSSGDASSNSEDSNNSSAPSDDNSSFNAPRGDSGSWSENGFPGGEWEGGNNQFSILNLLKVIAQFFSIIYVFAAITAVVEIIIHKASKKDRPLKEDLVVEETPGEGSPDMENVSEALVTAEAATENTAAAKILSEESAAEETSTEPGTFTDVASEPEVSGEASEPTEA
jgi:hypothetical protein